MFGNSRLVFHFSIEKKKTLFKLYSNKESLRQTPLRGSQKLLDSSQQNNCKVEGFYWGLAEFRVSYRIVFHVWSLHLCQHSIYIWVFKHWWLKNVQIFVYNTNCLIFDKYFTPEFTRNLPINWFCDN